MTIKEHLLNITGTAFDVVFDEAGNLVEFELWDSDYYCKIPVLAQRLVMSDTVVDRQYSIYEIVCINDKYTVKTEVCVDIEACVGYFLSAN